MIEFTNGRKKMDVFSDDSPLVLYGLKAQWRYDYPQYIHTWDTNFGHEANAAEDYEKNQHRKALSDWLMHTQDIAPNTVVIFQTHYPMGTDE